MSILNKKMIWLAWENHRRSKELSRYLLCDHYVFSSQMPRFFKFPYFILKTLFLLIRNRPKILIVQCPSVVLGCIVGFIKSIFGFKLVVDAHNAAIDPDGFYCQGIRFFYHYVQYKADLIIITNKELERFVSQKKKVVILPDRLPELSCRNKFRLSELYNIVYICSFNDDEPYPEMFKAAKLLYGFDATLYVTGSHKGIAPKKTKLTIPNNVKLTGFLSEQDYVDLLCSIDLGIVLTQRNGCLTCGAYELISLGKPMVITGTEAIKKFFNFGAVYCENTPESIASSVKTCIEQLPDMMKQFRVGRKQILDRWNRDFDKFLSRVKEL